MKVKISHRDSVIEVEFLRFNFVHKPFRKNRDGCGRVLKPLLRGKHLYQPFDNESS